MNLPAVQAAAFSPAERDQSAEQSRRAVVLAPYTHKSQQVKQDYI